MMLGYFNRINEKEIENILDRIKRRGLQGEYKAIAESQIKQIQKREYIHATPNPQVNYGNCMNPLVDAKEINFLPNTFMHETQHCFQHRRREQDNG